jgi:adenylate cyclase
MTETRTKRRLAAILAADVVGYSRMMAENEEDALARLKTLRLNAVDPIIARLGGRIFKNTGDGALAEFASALDAVHAALEIQRNMAEHNEDAWNGGAIRLRIGVSLGDVIVEADDLYGNGVNIAARMEGLAEPGGVCISSAVYDQIRSTQSLLFDDMGEQEIKNLDRPIRCYSVRLAPTNSMGPGGVNSADSDKPSIAVLPFQNMGADPEQDYFADGIVEEIITALSRFHWLFVIARNSTFTYKGKAVDVKRVGRELGVRYVVEGSVRRSSERIRITAQLIDARSGAHIWAERFDGSLQDIFDLQDQITSKIVAAVAPKVQQAEIERVSRKPTIDLGAYDHFLRGLASFNQRTKDSTDAALASFGKAVEADPNFAAAFGLAAMCYAWRQTNGWIADREDEQREASRLARRAMDMGMDDAVALANGAMALGQLVGELDDAAAMVDRALELNPNLAIAWLNSGVLRLYLGETDLAVKHLEHAMRLNPLDPNIFIARGGLAVANLIMGRLDEASALAERALADKPNWAGGLRTAAASHALAGRLEKAQSFMARLRLADPQLRISRITQLFPLRRPELLQEYLRGLRLAGLPE